MNYSPIATRNGQDLIECQVGGHPVVTGPVDWSNLACLAPALQTTPFDPVNQENNFFFPLCVIRFSGDRRTN